VNGSVRPSEVYVMTKREVHARVDGGERCMHDQHN
jgi:hypothetical protein